MPKPPPPPNVRVSDELRIPVKINGADAPPITAKQLLSKKPDFEKGEHRAWLIAPLIGAAAERDDALITVVGENDFHITMPRAKTADAHQPALMLSRRGEITAAMVSPEDPFPAFHGQGRRLARGGDPLPRVSGLVIEIRVTHTGERAGRGEHRGEEREETDDVEPIEIVSDGKKLAPWTPELFGAVKPVAIRAEGEGIRQAWSLRQLTERLVGPGARVVALTGAGKRRIELSAEDWRDEMKTPVLRVNRQGQFKLQWVGADGVLPDAEELRNIRVIEVSVPR